MDIFDCAFIKVLIHFDSALPLCVNKMESGPLAHHGVGCYSNSDAPQSSNNNKIKVSICVVLISKMWLTTVPYSFKTKQNKKLICVVAFCRGIVWRRHGLDLWFSLLLQINQNIILDSFGENIVSSECLHFVQHLIEGLLHTCVRAVCELIWGRKGLTEATTWLANSPHTWCSLHVYSPVSLVKWQLCFNII